MKKLLKLAVALAILIGAGYWVSVAFAQEQRQLTLPEAINNMAGCTQAYLNYAPSTGAQRQVAVESFNLVKAAMDNYIAWTTPAADAPALEAPAK